METLVKLRILSIMFSILSCSCNQYLIGSITRTNLLEFNHCKLTFKLLCDFLGNEDSDTIDNVVIGSNYRSCILYIYTVN